MRFNLNIPIPKCNIITLTASLVLLLNATYAQIEVYANIEKNSIKIGEQTKIKLKVKYNKKKLKTDTFDWPALEDTLKKEIEIVSISKIDTVIENPNLPYEITQNRQLVITCFDSGAYIIKPFKFILNNDTTNFKQSQPLNLYVNSVPTNTNAASVKDIKGPFDEPFDWRWYLNYAYGFLICIITGGIIFYLYQRYQKNKPKPIVPETQKIPPHIIALEQLEKIKQEAIWKHNKIKEYYSEITDAIRLYIEGRFKVPALELTTDEILKIFKPQVIDSDSKAKLMQILQLADFVKFAKQIPIEAEHSITLENAISFVNNTLRDEELLNRN